jgi:NAD(P)-dependent dehydrogenase (short-subunit alcohol dehydrogenase family)
MQSKISCNRKYQACGSGSEDAPKRAGAAVSAALKAAGYHVAATYHGNDAAAAKFKAETGIATYKWDVSNYKECAEGLKKVEADLGPIDILVNNAGITRDTAFHKMTPEQWYEVINTNLNSLFCQNEKSPEAAEKDKGHI